VKSLYLSIFDRGVRVDCFDARVKNLIAANYGWFTAGQAAPQLHYAIRRHPVSHAYILARDPLEPRFASDTGEFLFLFEKDMTIELQKLRRDLYFLHSAALEFRGRAILLVAPSGVGKSTATWGLLHHGFRYLSDELAPISLSDGLVHPYPRAVGLKQSPPNPYYLPASSLYTSRTIHVPVGTNLICGKPTPLGAIVFLQRGPDGSVPAIEPVSKGKAAMRLFANALNPLAHAGEGLQGAVGIVREASCFELTVGDLGSTCALVKSALEGSFRPESSAHA
jgi:hypothetical protein